MATASPLYGTNTAVTITLNSLASDTTLLIGRQSTAISNATADAMDFEIGGKFTLGATPTTGRQCEVWAGSSYDNGTNFTASAGASDAALTLTASRKALLRLVQIVPTDATASGVYVWGGVLLSQVFGFVPLHVFFWVVQNTGLALAASGNEIRYTPIKFESA